MNKINEITSLIKSIQSRNEKFNNWKQTTIKKRTNTKTQQTDNNETVDLNNEITSIIKTEAPDKHTAINKCEKSIKSTRKEFIPTSYIFKSKTVNNSNQRKS